MARRAGHRLEPEPRRQWPHHAARPAPAAFPRCRGAPNARRRGMPEYQSAFCRFCHHLCHWRHFRVCHISATLDGMDAAAMHCQALLKNFRARQAPVFIVQHLFTPPNPPFFAPDTHGAELHHSVAPAARDRVIVKHAVNCFLGTELLQELHRAGAGRGIW